MARHNFLGKEGNSEGELTSLGPMSLALELLLYDCCHLPGFPKQSCGFRDTEINEAKKPGLKWDPRQQAGEGGGACEGDGAAAGREDLNKHRAECGNLRTSKISQTRQMLQKSEVRAVDV